MNWRKAFRDVKETITHARRHPGALRFIITSLVYQDAIGTIVSFMTLYGGAGKMTVVGGSAEGIQGGSGGLDYTAGLNGNAHIITASGSTS